MNQKMHNALNQRFSTWGTHTPRGSQAVIIGYTGSSRLVFKIQKVPKQEYMGEIFDLGVCKGIQS